MNSTGAWVIASCFALGSVGVVIEVPARNLVPNGSLEDFNGAFVNTAANYMALSASANSTAIADWIVSPATSNEIVWAKSPTGDHHNAADGTFFVDLTGFGADSPNGAVQQSLQNLIIN